MIHKGEWSENCTLEDLVWTSGGKKNSKGSTAGKTAQESCSISIPGGFQSSTIKAMADPMACWQWSC